MQALRLYGANDLRLEEIPAPRALPGGIVVKVGACSICGSDLRNVRAGGSSHGMTLPVTLGHELSGTVHEMGENVTEFAPGDKVVLAAIIPCGRCHYCLTGSQNLCVKKEALSYQYDGGFAEYISIPPAILQANGVIKLPESISLVEAAITEPCSCALNGQELSSVGLGDAVVVMGAGPLGLVHCVLAKRRGAAKVMLVDIVEGRLELSKKFAEIDVRINGSKEDVVARVLKETDGVGANAVIIASPANSAQADGIKMAAKRGRVNLFGGLPKDRAETTFDANVIHYKELFVHGTSDSTIPHMRAILQMVETGMLKPGDFITKVLPLSQYAEGFKIAGDGSQLKVVLVPGN